jgi:hypothetical protein
VTNARARVLRVSRHDVEDGAPLPRSIMCRPTSRLM